MSETASYPRLFTIDEANATLSGIKASVEQLLETFREIRGEIQETAARAGLPVGSPDLPRHLEARGRATQLFERVKQLIDRIHSSGCLVNGPEAGLVDFPCLYNNEIVFLCWKYGEPRVGHWHRIPDGFAGRRPLLDDSDPGSGDSVH